MTFSYIICGFFVGILIGLTGVGGGSLMTPLLTIIFGINPSVAIGTDLVFSTITKSAGTFVHKLKSTVHWEIVKLFCIGAIPSSIITIFLIKYYISISDQINLILSYLISFSVLLTAFSVIFRNKIKVLVGKNKSYQLSGKNLTIMTIISGIFLGFLVTISSIGAGAIGATVLIILYPKLTASEIAGTDLAYAVPLTAVASVGHWWIGTINWSLLILLLFGSIPGIILGSLMSKSIPENFLRTILAAVLVIVAVKVVYV